MAQKQTSQSFSYRVTRGTTFLGLEHAMHLLFVVVLAVLITVGLITVIYPLLGWSFFKFMPGLSIFWSTGVVWLAAALFTISPLVWLLDVRTRAEWPKRPGFTQRLAYKLPLYIALGVVSIGKLVAWVAVLALVLFGLVGAGTTSILLAAAWVAQIIPATIALIVFGVTGWYLIRRAKGIGTGRSFTNVFAGVGLLLGFVLLVTAAVTLQAHQRAEVYDHSYPRPATPGYFYR